ncbi:MAG: PhoX family phosphatase [Lautropia sp.]
MSHLDADPDDNASPNPHLREVIARSLHSPGRRGVVRGGLGIAAALALPALPAVARDNRGPGTAANGVNLSFDSVGKSLKDDVILPAGYRYRVVHATGDRLDYSVAPYGNQGREADDWSLRIGDHHDGMDLFAIDANGRYASADTGRALLCVNHESSADAHFFHPRGQTSNGVGGKKFTQFGDWDLGARPADEVLKEINHHGVSVVELTQANGRWSYRVDSPFNRRINPQTPVRFGGPAAHLADIRALMVTRHDPRGEGGRGTLNNCGHGKTPWGTYLSCEENWAYYFQMPTGSKPVDPRTVAARRRYGVAREPLTADATKAISQGWASASSTDDRFSRWDVSAAGPDAAGDFRNEPNTFGYNVEIDPVAPHSMPVKRIGMGRMAHEAAVCGVPTPGQPLAFYMGCDARNEYIYKFVSAANWDPADIGRGLAAGDKYLDEGRLYVARFDADGTGRWLELTVKDPSISGHAPFPFSNQAEVLVFTRHAADALGATKMDRPEWGAVNPANGEVYFTLTNNTAANRTPAKVDAANPRAYADRDGKKGTGNPNGHIIRFREQDGRAAATTFNWDIFLFAAEEDAGDANLSQLTAANAFSSPDGLWFSPTTGICWIQTDDGAMTDESHCMMLAAIPGAVGDGGPITAVNRMKVGDEELEGTRQTFMGALLGERRLRRFLVGPAGCEITGVTESADGRTMFVNIQHPGEGSKALGDARAFEPQSHWPGSVGYGPTGRPRSATIAITRDDGGVIGA